MLSFGTMSTQVAGHTYSDLRKKNVDPNRAATTAIGAGLVEGALEQAGFGRIIKTFGKEGAQKLWKHILTAGAQSGVVEGATEALQNYVHEAIMIYGEAKNQSMDFLEGVREYIDRLPETSKQAMFEGIIGSVFGFVGGGAGASFSASRTDSSQMGSSQAKTSPMDFSQADFSQTQAEAQINLLFIEKHKDLHAIIENTQTKTLSPDHMSSALRSAGINQNVVFSAKDMAILYESFPKNVEQMGYNIADIQKKADSGQSIEIPLADIHAHLDAETFNAWADYMRFIPTYKKDNGNNNADMNTPKVYIEDTILDSLKAGNTVDLAVLEKLAPKNSWARAALNDIAPLEALKKNIAKLFKDAEAGNFTEEKVYYAFINEQDAKKIKQDTGLDIQAGFKHSVDANQINHALFRHGVGNEKQKKQIPITMKDIQLIPEIVKNPDTVVDAGLTRSGEQGIKYSKKMPDGTIIFVEVMKVSDKEFSFKTMYKKQTTQK